MIEAGSRQGVHNPRALDCVEACTGICLRWAPWGAGSGCLGWALSHALHRDVKTEEHPNGL